MSLGLTGRMPASQIPLVGHGVGFLLISNSVQVETLSNHLLQKEPYLDRREILSKFVHHFVQVVLFAVWAIVDPHCIPRPHIDEICMHGPFCLLSLFAAGMPILKGIQGALWLAVHCGSYASHILG